MKIRYFVMAFLLIGASSTPLLAKGKKMSPTNKTPPTELYYDASIDWYVKYEEAPPYTKLQLTRLYYEVQVELRHRNYYSGPFDGKIAPDFVEAIKRFQVAAEMPATGKITGSLIRDLNIRETWVY